MHGHIRSDSRFPDDYSLPSTRCKQYGQLGGPVSLLGEVGITVNEPVIEQQLSMIVTKGTTLGVVGLLNVEGMCSFSQLETGLTRERWTPVWSSSRSKSAVAQFTNRFSSFRRPEMDGLFWPRNKIFDHGAFGVDRHTYMGPPPGDIQSP